MSSHKFLAKLPQEQAVQAITMIFDHLKDWPMKSAERFRNAALGDNSALAINPFLGIEDDSIIAFLKDSIHDTIADGRMIDFGFIPNQFIIDESVRSRVLFELGELPHPFESWIAVTSWEGGFNGYWFTPHPIHEGEIMAVELYGVTVPNLSDVILIYDIVAIKIKGLNDTTVSPVKMYYPGGQEETEDEIRKRGANSLDPLVTMLRLLSDASVPIEIIEEPVRLNRIRERQGRHRIPAHTVVHARDYITAVQSHAPVAKGLSKGGHHASPVSHWRRAHARHLKSGKVVAVKSSRVNWRGAEELHRLFYKIRE